MNKILLINTHSFSNHQQMVDSINESKKTQVFCTYTQYSHFLDFDVFNKYKHKAGNDPHRIYGDILFNNLSFYCSNISNYIRFIHFIGRPEYVIPNLVEINKMNINNACLHYLFRLRRICEIAYSTNNMLFFSYEDLFNKSFYEKINNFLNDEVGVIKGDFIHPVKVSGEVKSAVDECSKSYEKYYLFLKERSSVKV